jgi:predicted alpha-1,2-mannosidase
MRTRTVTLALAVCLLGLAPGSSAAFEMPSAPPAAARALTSLVNPFVGTGGHGHTYPGASMPFGMVQLSPDTRLEGWDGCSGYHYSDSRVYGFSHTHLSGTGVPDYCDVLFAPSTGEARVENGADGKPGYSSTFRHETERASPGFYAVRLDDYGVDVELTATKRVGLHRYTFPAGKPAHVVVDLSHRDEVRDASVRFAGDREIEGHRRSRAWAQDQRVYFVARFSRPLASRAIAVDGALREKLERAEGKSVKAVLGFGDAGGPLVVKVGISAVSVEGARKNLDAEASNLDFDAARRAADAAWERELGRILVEGGTEKQQRIFYTALYHALLSPNLFADVDGQYLGRDLKPHRAAGFDYYTVFSLWDTFRALHPLLTITHRRETADFVRTFLAQYEQGGRLPVWELAANETDCMIGYHAVPVIADAMMKGIGGFDERLAFEAMRHSGDEERRGVGAYKQHGYLPAEADGESVSKTLEYGYDDWCIALAARKLGLEGDYRRFLERSQAYKHLFDPSTGFMRARMEGVWYAPFDPAEVNFNYTEANAWQYSFYVPHDMDGLVALHGGKERFAAKLDALFGADSRLTGNEQSDITGLVGQYAHGNEPSHHIAYLYAFAGQPWKTQEMVHRLVETMYSDAPDGLAGNEDCGQMSAWYVMSALGFYSVTPGTNEYVIGTPLFPKATIRLENGKTFVVRAPGVSDSAFYVQSARLDGRDYTRAFLDHGSIAEGGELLLEMGATPNTSWGVGEGNEPRTGVDEHLVLPIPFVAEGASTFHDRTSVALGDAAPGVEIRYTLDGTAPSATSPRYERPIAIDATTTVKAIAVRDGRASAPLEATFYEMIEGRRVSLDATYNKQYGAGGDLALVDGLRGGPNYRTGRWQGYQGQDLVAVVDLGREQEIHRIAMGFLQDAWSWVMMPRDVSFAISEDGVRFDDVGTVANTLSEREMSSTVRDFAVEVGSRRARYVRVRVRHYGNLPAWHPGAGSPAFFFADEIVVE